LASGEALDLHPAALWPAPHVARAPEPEEGPVLVQVTYRIDPAQANAFSRAAANLGRLRRLEGAARWLFWAYCAEAGRYVAISLGLWQNFGDDRALATQRAIVARAFDRGVTHFDLANNYGPPYGAAEANFGRILRSDLQAHRDELIISTKAGYDMWPGPYGD